MELADLDGDERLALVALIRTTVLADRAVSEDEEALLGEVVETFGEDAYRAATEEVDRRFTSEASLKEFLARVGRPEAREIIYGLAFEMAMGEVVTGNDIPLLSWLGEAWHLEAAIDGASDELS